MADKNDRQLSMKRIGVDKANARIFMIIAGASFLVVFFLVASYSLFGELNFRNRVINNKKAAVEQLKLNVDSSQKLVKSYRVFTAAETNFIAGSANGTGPQGGSNPKITLDALPSKYDFPAFTTSLEKLALDQQVTIDGITGSDDEVAQAGQSSNSPAPVEIPFEIKLTGDYISIQKAIDSFDRSIRPIQIQTMKINGDQTKLNLTITAKTYYQPEKTLKIRMKDIK